MTTKRNLAVAITVLVLIAAPVARGLDIRVDHAGGGDYLTITAGLAVAIPGDTVQVAEGTYPEYGLAVGPDVALQGGYEAVGWTWNAAVYITTIDANGNPTALLAGSGCTIDGFTIQGFTDRGVDVTSGSPTIYDSVIHGQDTGQYGIHVSGGSPDISYCLVQNCTTTGIYVTGAVAGSITDCLIGVCGLYGIHCTGSGVVPQVSGSTLLANNVGIYVESGALPTIGGSPAQWNFFVGNVSFGVQNADPATCLNAEYNDWNDSGGPDDDSYTIDGCMDDGNDNDPGENVSDDVDYAPWFGQSTPVPTATPGFPPSPTATGTHCSNNGDCGSGYYCQKAVGDCGGTGTCQERPSSCPPDYTPVCGCNGLTYDNPCYAAQAGVNIDYFGPCNTPVPQIPATSPPGLAGLICLVSLAILGGTSLPWRSRKNPRR